MVIVICRRFRSELADLWDLNVNPKFSICFGCLSLLANSWLSMKLELKFNKKWFFLARIGQKLFKKKIQIQFWTTSLHDDQSVCQFSWNLNLLRFLLSENSSLVFVFTIKPIHFILVRIVRFILYFFVTKLFWRKI